MPPEMIESMRLMQEGRMTGDMSKIQRAEELAKQAMELDPVLKKNVNAMQKKQNAPQYTNLPVRDYTSNFDGAMDPLEKAKSVTDNINRLKADMEAQLAALKKTGGHDQWQDGINPELRHPRSHGRLYASGRLYRR